MSGSSQSFYIVSESGYVLTTTEEGSIILSTRFGRKNQLWKWDGKRLLSKYNTALDVNNKIDVVSSRIREGTSQQWSFKDDRLVNAENGLLLSTWVKNPSEGSRTIMSALSSSKEQTWVIEPHLGMVDMDLLLSKEPSDVNPVAVVCYWKSLLGDSDEIKALLGCSISGYKQNVKEAFEKLNKCAEILDKVTKGTGVARATGAGLGIAGGAMGLTGLILAPFTGGISLILTVGGAVIGGAGGATSITGLLVRAGWKKSETKKAKEVTNSVVQITQTLQNLLTVYLIRLGEAEQFLNTVQAISIENESILENLFETGKTGKTTAKLGFKVYKIGKGAATLYKGVGNYSEFMNVVKIIQTDFPALAQGSKVGLATSTAAPRPLLFGRIFGITAASTGAKAFSGVLSVVGIGFGIWEAIDAAGDISNGSDIAKRLRSTAENIQSASSELLNVYDKLVIDQ